MPTSRGSSRTRDQTSVFYISCIGRRVLYHQHHLKKPRGPFLHPQSQWHCICIFFSTAAPISLSSSASLPLLRTLVITDIPVI